MYPSAEFEISTKHSVAEVHHISPLNANNIILLIKSHTNYLISVGEGIVPQ